MERIPQLGDTVHFRQGSHCYTATIVHVWTPTCVNLFVPPTGTTEPVPGALNENRNAMSVTYDDKLHGSEWSWHWAK